MRTNWQKFIDRMTNETRARRMDPSKLEEVRILHRQMLEYLFNMFDEDDVRGLFPLLLLSRCSCCSCCCCWWWW